jgi:hypothetical protein
MRKQRTASARVVCSSSRSFCKFHCRSFRRRTAPARAAQRNRTAPSPAYVFSFLATTDGLALTKAFMQIKQASLRRRIVHLVEEIAGDDLS